MGHYAHQICLSVVRIFFPKAQKSQIRNYAPSGYEVLDIFTNFDVYNN